MTKRTARVLCPLLIGVLVGCASDESLRSTLDEDGVTWAGMDVTITLARPAPRFSATARDYLYIAPIEGNDQGSRRHYLWLGLGTTVDRGWVLAAPSSAITLVLLVDGLPVALPLSSWDADVGMLHDAPSPVYAVQRARVTSDQLQRIAHAQSVEVQLVAADGAAARYELWDGAWSDWSAAAAAGR